MAVFPVAGQSIKQQTDTFGAPRSGGRSHKGIDIFANEGTPVVAVKGGTVVKAGNSGLGGIRAWVRDDDGLFHYYAHMNTLSVQAGDRVSAGQTIGGVGKTGNARSTPAHLHYSVNAHGHTSESGSLNPYEYLSGTSSQRGGRLVEGHDADVLAQPNEQGVVEAEPEFRDPNQEFEEAERAGDQTMANIITFISDSVAAQGGKEIDLSGLFGSVLEDVEAEDDLIEEVS